MQNDNAYMGEQKVGKLLAKFSVPCMLALLVSALYNIVDQIFIGNSSVGMYGIAATTVVFPITVIGQAFAYLCGDGTAAFMAISEGEDEGVMTPETRKGSKLSKAVAGTLSLTVIFSVIIIAVAFPLKEPILYLLGASENTIGYAVDYFNIIVAFFPAFMLMNMLNAVVRADGSPRYAMAASLTGAILNIILDPIFIFACGWGIKGAAWATVTGQVVSFVLCIIYLFRSRMFRLSFKAFIPDFRLIWKCIRLGISSFINQIAIDIMAISLNMLLSSYGAMSVYGEDIPIAAIGIETKVFTIVLNIFAGLVLGGQPILGYNYGARKFDRVRSCYKLILLWTLIVGAAATILIESIPQYILAAFGTSTDSSGYDQSLYIEYGKYTLRIFLALVICNGVTKISGVVFQALGKPGKAMAVALVRDIVAFIPLVILIPYISEMYNPGSGVVSLLYAGPAADFIGCVLTAILTVFIFRGLKKEEAAYKRSLELKEKFTQQAGAPQAQDTAEETAEINGIQ
ncbi:MAG: MATE family efflux transporter [Clostridia bacterium]|nr:MATE family efflux transporter [Clostridia bacterium]